MMPRRSDDKKRQLPSDSVDATPPTDRRKCGAECVSFSGEGLISAPSPVKEKKNSKRAEEQSAKCVSHVTPILHRPALRYPFSGEGSNSTPLHVKQLEIQAPQSKHVADVDKDDCRVRYL